jgi:hypothetical protein
MKNVDYRMDQSRRDWWNGRIYWLLGMTRRDLSMIAVGALLVVLWIKFLPPVDFILGIR